MGRRYIKYLCLAVLVFPLVCFGFMQYTKKGMKIIIPAAIRMEGTRITDGKIRRIELLKGQASALPVLPCEQIRLQNPPCEKELLTDEDLENLCRIVQAEAGGEDLQGKLLVANVVLNRVEDERFPDTVTEVIFERNEKTVQFSPTVSDTFYERDISEETKEAVLLALEGEDMSEGALYFAARKRADETAMRWFDTKCEYLFRHGGHEFFK